MKSLSSACSQVRIPNLAGSLNINPESFSKTLPRRTLTLSRIQISFWEHNPSMKPWAKRSSLLRTAPALPSTGRENPRNNNVPKKALVKNRYFQFKSLCRWKNSCCSSTRANPRVYNTSSLSDASPWATLLCNCFYFKFYFFQFQFFWASIFNRTWGGLTVKSLTWADQPGGQSARMARSRPLCSRGRKVARRVWRMCCPFENF